jgi:hypothetical protein
MKKYWVTVAMLMAAAAGLSTAMAAQAVPPPGTNGSGQFLFAGTADVMFDFNAVQAGNGNAAGGFFQSFVFGGLLIEFRGRVTCVSTEPDTGRAWIGGIVIENNSTHPQFTTDRTQVGRDIWFRVVDYGEGAGAPADRSTIMGFSGDRDIITSAEYCATQPWVDGDVATHPVIEGNIQVR